MMSKFNKKMPHQILQCQSSFELSFRQERKASSNQMRLANEIRIRVGRTTYRRIEASVQAATVPNLDASTA
jgi:hypothetical protein